VNELASAYTSALPREYSSKIEFENTWFDGKKPLPGVIIQT